MLCSQWPLLQSLPPGSISDFLLSLCDEPEVPVLSKMLLGTVFIAAVETDLEQHINHSALKSLT